MKKHTKLRGKTEGVYLLLKTLLEKEDLNRQVAMGAKQSW